MAPWRRLWILLVAAIAYAGGIVTGWANSPTLVAQPGVTAPASIPELARALKYDVNLIYEYVYTNIEYSPTFGVKKGALGTLLDGAGNDMDQSMLLVALLRQSGYTVNYMLGAIRLYPAALNFWLGVDTTTNACPLVDLLTNGAISFQISVSDPSTCTSTLNYADIEHVWVAVTGGSLGSTTYYLDPSLKTYVSSSGISLSTATGYDQATFLSGAESGSSYTPGFSIQHVNTGNIAASLASYANNLVGYIRANNPTATTRDVIGGRLIQPLVQPYALPTSLTYITPGTTPSPIFTDDDMRLDFGTTLQIQIGGISKTYFGDQIYGHRLSVIYNTSNQPVLYLDGVVQGTGSAGANIIAYTVAFPFCYLTTGPVMPACVGTSGTTNIFPAQNTVQATPGYAYAIVAGWDFAGRGMVEFHRQQQQTIIAGGASPSSEAALGESLNVLAYSWLAQFSASIGVFDQLVGTKTVMLCAIGVVAQVAGPYIDMPGIFSGGPTSLTFDPSGNRVLTTAFSNVGAGSALEWGNLAQYVSKAGVGAVSTVKLIDLANTQGDTIYLAKSANWTSVQAQLSGYSTADTADIKNNYIDNGFGVILPQHGNLTQGIWVGAGYMAAGIDPTTGLNSLVYKISSNLKGGYTDFDLFAIDWYQLAADISVPPPDPPQVVAAEPIDLSSGAYLYDHDDISIGSVAFPIGLTFARSYNSGNVFSASPLGKGWTHNFAISATPNSDGFKGMGQDSPIDGAVAIAAAYVIQDLFSDPIRPLDKVVIATLVQKWLMDRLINNTVNVVVGPQVEQFVLLADGTYNPRLGSSSRLSLAGSNYTFQTKDGVTLNFDVDGNISSWLNPTGVTVSFAYDASTPPLLTSVSNSVGRTLTLGYNGSNQLTSVTDNSSPTRSVSYNYGGSGNLASVTDPLGSISTFSYAVPVGTQLPPLLTQIFYPSNPTTAFVTNTYDSLGRVATQANATGATWNYFFAGYRSEEDDPYGTQHVLYYNPRGKALFDIQDYAGLNLLTAITYDGLDRLSSLTQPEGGNTTYTYDTTNLWANNVASAVRVPKPGSGLSYRTTSYTYEPIFNKPTSITDPLGLVTTMGYDAKTGNLLSIAADKGASPHFNATTRYTYNGLGQPTSGTDPMGMVTRNTYDSYGNLIARVRDPGAGHVNETTLYGYNLRGDVTSVTDPRGNVAIATYDAARRLRTSTAPAALGGVKPLVTTLVYDADGHILQTQQSAAGIILRTTGSTYTATGKLATSTDANGNVTRYAYDLLERLAGTTDAMQRVTTYAYDALSRPYRVYNMAIQANPLLQLSYTADGLRAMLSDANGNTTNFAYDGFDRLVTTTYPNPGTGSTTETFTYDADSNVKTRKTRADSTITYTYDTLNRLTIKSPPSAPVVTYSYDLTGRLTSVSDTSAAIASIVAGSGISYTTSYTYDGLNHLLGVSWTPAPTAAASPATSITFNHTYNTVNQRIGQAASDKIWINYPPGTASTTSYTTNVLNQYTAVGAVSPTYNTNGNLTADGAYTFGYDAENRLVSASKAGTAATYDFDGRGRRKQKTVNGSKTVSITDADNRGVLEYDGTSGAILRWYAYGLGPNDVLGQMNVPANTRSGMLPDIQGSFIGNVDGGTGTISSFAYQPYGAATTTPAQFGYTGQQVDAESGLYYYRARHYSPAWGRFLQPDPLEITTALHLYIYVRNDPLNLVDSRGMVQEPAQPLTPAQGPSFQPNSMPIYSQDGSGFPTTPSSPNIVPVGNPITSGPGPNLLHQLGVDAAVADYQSRGFEILSPTSKAAVVPGFDTPRFYDFYAYDPIAKINIGVEVKTTLIDIINLRPSQVAKDVAVVAQGGIVPTLGGIVVRGVAYANFCAVCADIRSVQLRTALEAVGVPFRTYNWSGQIGP